MCCPSSWRVSCFCSSEIYWSKSTLHHWNPSETRERRRSRYGKLAQLRPSWWYILNVYSQINSSIKSVIKNKSQKGHSTETTCSFVNLESRPADPLTTTAANNSMQGSSAVETGLIYSHNLCLFVLPSGFYNGLTVPGASLQI